MKDVLYGEFGLKVTGRSSTRWRPAVDQAPMWTLIALQRLFFPDYPARAQMCSASFLGTPERYFRREF